MSPAKPWAVLQQEEGRPALCDSLGTACAQAVPAAWRSLTGLCSFSAPTLGEVSTTPRGNKNTGERDPARSRPRGPLSKPGGHWG